MTGIRSFVALALSLTLILPAHAEDKYAKAIGVFNGSPVVQPCFKGAYGYAVFPSIGKGGIGIGGAHGKGQGSFRIQPVQ